MMGYMESWSDAILDKIKRAMDIIDYEGLS